MVMGYGENEVEANRNHDENLTREVKFMGHLITKDGLKPVPEKIKAVQQMPRPTSKKELLGLLGFVKLFI